MTIIQGVTLGFLCITLFLNCWTLFTIMKLIDILAQVKR